MVIGVPTGSLASRAGFCGDCDCEDSFELMDEIQELRRGDAFELSFVPFCEPSFSLLGRLRRPGLFGRLVEDGERGVGGVSGA